MAGIFKKPPLTKLSKRIGHELLDRRFTDDDLRIIAGQVVEWEDKARGLGLTKRLKISETIITDIVRCRR